MARTGSVTRYINCIQDHQNVLADELQRHFEEVQPMDFYRAVFPLGELSEWSDNPQAERDSHGHSYTGITVRIHPDNKETGEKGRVERYSVTDDLDTVKDMIQRTDGIFTVMAPISYAGKSRKSKNARFMYALCIEIDNLKVNKKGQQEGLIMLLRFCGLSVEPKYPRDQIKMYPTPTYIVASGNGVHLYYVFERPIPMFENVVESLKAYKKYLTRFLWNHHVTYTYKEEQIQYESIFQAFRMVGTITKRGSIARAYETGEKVSIEYMNSYIKDDKCKISLAYKSNLPLAKAKAKYPDWYQKRIIEQQPRGRWVCKRDLYDWWLRQITEKASVGHRYYCLMTLSMYAVKCCIDEDELQRDCLYLMGLFKEQDKPGNEFTEHDVNSALQAYNDGVVTTPISYISMVSGIPIERSKRNGRKQKDHVVVMNTMKTLKKQLGEEVKDGRPAGSSREREQITAWRHEHPTGRKCDCIRALGFDKKTVYRWWDVPAQDAVADELKKMLQDMETL